MKTVLKIVSNPRYFAPLFVFASINILMGTWILYIPYVKDKLNLNDAEIGIALFSFAIGALISIPFAPKIINRFGTGKITGIGILLFTVFYIFPILSTSYYQLCLALFIVGIFSSITNIAMNSLVAEIEREDQVNFMSTAHGFFSLGGVIGAGLGGILLTFIEQPYIHFLIIILLVSSVNLFCIRQYYAIKTYIKKEKEQFSFSKFKPLLLLALIGIIISGNEGAIEHWSSLFLKDRVHANDNAIGLGFLFFSFFMMLGRFFGDRISANIGSFKVLLYGFLIAIVGHLLVLTAQFIITIVGFSFLGIGFSVIFPELIRLASRSKTYTPPVAISFVSGIGFLGFVSAPVFMGYISKISNLSYSFGVLTISCIVAILFVFRLRKVF
ncbi:MFS transporter [Tenacibaculum amylolyticum]|uniref:MFS transporter n=1 Tax=Tenacibaculum amylolyticum TaxID=104269 RepID=UPI003893EC8D